MLLLIFDCSTSNVKKEIVEEGTTDSAKISPTNDPINIITVSISKLRPSKPLEPTIRLTLKNVSNKPRYLVADQYYSLKVQALEPGKQMWIDEEWLASEPFMHEGYPIVLEQSKDTVVLRKLSKQLLDNASHNCVGLHERRLQELIEETVLSEVVLLEPDSAYTVQYATYFLSDNKSAYKNRIYWKYNTSEPLIGRIDLGYAEYCKIKYPTKLGKYELFDGEIFTEPVDYTQPN